MSYAVFSDILSLMKPSLSLAAMTDYWPPFSFIIDVLVDKSLGFNSCLVAYLDEVLSIHYFALSLSNFNNF